VLCARPRGLHERDWSISYRLAAWALEHRLEGRAEFDDREAHERVEDRLTLRQLVVLVDEVRQLQRASKGGVAQVRVS
jgi:hypothetical protein